MKRAPRILIVVSILTLVVSVLGFVATLVLNTFVLDKFNAYGELPIPGSTALELPAGEMTVSFHTVTTGRPTSGFPIPDLSFGIKPAGGLSEPTVTENIGGTTSVNSDIRVRIWTVQIPQAGTYEVETNGSVDGYIAPRLAFGHDSSHGWVLWIFGGLFVFALFDLFAALIWSARVAKKARPLEPDEQVTSDPPTRNPEPTASYTPTDQGVRLEQIRQLAALRDSGALTEDEYTAEKRRILDGN
jgi:hypothetical protein